MLHYAPNGAVNRALTEIGKLSVIKGKPVMLAWKILKSNARTAPEDFDRMGADYEKFKAHLIAKHR